MMEKTKKRRIDCQEATGAKVLNSLSWRSPRTQYRSLNLLIVPSGKRLIRKTQVPGKILLVAKLMFSSIQVLFFSKPRISFSAASCHFGRLLISCTALSKVRVSGSEAAALYATLARAPTYWKRQAKCAASWGAGST